MFNLLDYLILTFTFKLYVEVKTARNILVHLPTRRSAIRIGIKQFPIINAISITTYKVQGEMLPAMVVDNWRCHNKADHREQGYLMVSRATNRYSFLALKSLTAEDCNYFKPSPMCLLEDNRLLELSNKNLNEFYGHSID